MAKSARSASAAARSGPLSRDYGQRQVSLVAACGQAIATALSPPRNASPAWSTPSRP
jgi:hypothetical protein